MSKTLKYSIEEQFNEEARKLIEYFTKNKINSIVEGFSFIKSIKENFIIFDLSESSLSQTQKLYLKEKKHFKNLIKIIKKDLFLIYFNNFIEITLNDIEKIQQNNIFNFKIIEQTKFEVIVDNIIKNEENFSGSCVFDLSYIWNQFFKNNQQQDYSKFIKKVKKSIENKRILILKNNWIIRFEMYNELENIAKSLKKISQQANIKLPISYDLLSKFDYEKKNAIELINNNNVSIIYGNAGTGKSKIIEIYTAILNENEFDNFAILTPTGRSARNLKSKIQNEYGIVPYFIKTIHSFLGVYDNLNRNIRYNYEMLKQINIVIIDEFSMVNIHLLNKLFQDLENLKKIIFVGDSKQLPAIGPGDLLNDFINFDKFASFELTNNYRLTVENNLTQIIKNVIQNKIPYDNNIIFTNQMVKDVGNLYLQKIQEYNQDNVIIIGPTWKGAKGLDVLNNYIQSKLTQNNKMVYESKFINNNINMRPRFFIGDKVMIIKNLANGLCNGDIGYIKNFINNKIYVKFVDEKNEYAFEANEFASLFKLSYATSVHKYQGSEEECVIFVNSSEPYYKMRDKNLVYTAITRAKKELIVYEDVDYEHEKLWYWIYKNKTNRITLMSQFLNKFFDK
ncbi:AAA family ATPase [Mycoplasma phocimorsus]|uniref:AAA family ATPase n=1 Tax=Mycoplasma phocimorsus TaxID=3045839 RepID=UPI0024C0DA86|nr:AAA family ATPase [Mycoplasma phocimorsus]MDJ1647056.1 AAA family ATPase [Mycoplasma phocimorsus]